MHENISLKENISSTEFVETWIAFERVKKKRLILKRFSSRLFETKGLAARFDQDATAWESLDPKVVPPQFLQLRMHGIDDEWFWFVREAQGINISLFESIQQGKLIQSSLELKKRFGLLSNALVELHTHGLVHRNLNPYNIYLVESDSILFSDPDIGHFLDPSFFGQNYVPERHGNTAFLAPEQRSDHGNQPTDARTDIWSLAACIAFAATGQSPHELDFKRLPSEFSDILAKAMQDDPGQRFNSMGELRNSILKAQATSAGISIQSQNSVQSRPALQPQDPKSNLQLLCPQCNQPVVPSSRFCPHCNRGYEVPCLACNSQNPFWVKVCRNCGVDLQKTIKLFAERLQSQQQQVLKMRENYGHDHALQILKQMSTLTHPDFVAFRDWAKSLLPTVQKERRDIRNGIDNIRVQAKAALEEQKYEKVQETLAQVPQPLVDEEMRVMYQEAGKSLLEVDRLIREIRNSIATKQYNTLLSCVQRYLDLKAYDPEAKNLQEKIEKLTTFTSPTGMKFRRIPPGCYSMGSHESDEFIRSNERPQHRVTLTNSMLVGVYLVTQGDFSKLMDFNPSVSTDKAECPVDNATWFTALEFCNKLSDEEGLSHYYELKNIKRRSTGMVDKADVVVLGGDGYRLPTEAEWEYSCRAGSIMPWCFGDQVLEVGRYAWYFDNSQMETHPVGSKKPNSWGLYDMHGNVMEWCFDWYGEFYYQQCGDIENPTGPEDGTGRTLRGGAWQFGAEATRSAYRNSCNPETSSSMIGFRVVRNISAENM